MAVKRARRAEADRLTAEKDAAIARLDEYGLCPEDRLRWHDGKGESYSYGRPKYVNQDDSIAVYADGWRSIDPAKIEVRSTGPRGGEIWVPLSEWV